ncbi:hypothetical protein [Bradyrhizobium sp. AUGA SZCCT0160]|nr:hypothetical protein [Bradyrhizobium sp. AUGA SZCCT0160]MBR1191329.1 hypothetical protein [Bradyrhizobium sp. AUGA SZCCT0160]
MLRRFAPRNDENWHANIPGIFPNSGIVRGFMTGKTMLPGWRTCQETCHD